MKATSEAGPLLMGAAAVEVTPLGPVALSGFGARTLPSTGVHDGLYARALAVAERGGAPVVIVTVDVLGVGSDLVAEVRAGLARAGVDRGRVAVVATHTHAGPATLRRAFLGDVDAVVVSRIVDGAVAAGRAALEALEPAEVRFGRRPVPGVARNRRVAGGPVDDELAVLSFWRPGGTTPAALLVSFALHPVVLGPDNLLVSRDYVGYVVDAVESDHPGATVLFACGCAGQVNSGHPATASWTTAAAAGRTFEAAAAIGGTLSAAVRDVVAVGSVAVAGPGDGGPRSAAPRPEPRAQQHVVAPRVAVAGATVDLTLSEVDSEPDAEVARLEAESRAAAERGDAAATGLVAGQLGWARRRAALAAAGEAPGGGVTAELQGIRIGDVIVLLLPGEPFVEYGLALKERHPSVITIGYANDAPGYLPTATAVGEGGYEVDLAYRYYGQAAPFHPRCEADVHAACDELIGRLRPDTLV